MSVRFGRWGAVIGAGALVVSLVACTTTSSPTPSGTASAVATSMGPAAPATGAELLSKVTTAVKAATSVHIVATGTVSLDLAGTTDGTDGHYQVTSDGTKMEALLAGGGFYVKGDDAFWKAWGVPSASTLLAGRWMKMPEAQKKALGQLTVPGTLAEMITSITPDKVAPTVESTTLDGKPVYVFSDAAGKDQGQCYVAADGSWLPVKVTGKGVDAATFSEWNSVPRATVPPADQVVDASAG